MGGAESESVVDKFVCDCCIDDEFRNCLVLKFASDGDDSDAFAVLLINCILDASLFDEGFDAGIFVGPFDGTELSG